MRIRHVRTQLMLMLVLVLSLTSGCQYLGVRKPETPMERYVVASRSYTLLMDTARDLHGVGVLDLEDMQRVYEASKLVERGFQAWEMALMGEGDIESAKLEYEEGMAKLREIISSGGAGDGDSGSGRGGSGEPGD